MEKQTNLTKASQLPIYESCCHSKFVAVKHPPSNSLQPYVASAREEIQNYVNPIVGDYPQQVLDIISVSKNIVNEYIKVVQDEKNQSSRAVFIASAGFVSFLLGRRGFIKRSTFGLIGAASAAAICDPELAKNSAEVSYELMKNKTKNLYSQYGDLKSLQGVLENILNQFPSSSK